MTSNNIEKVRFTMRLDKEIYAKIVKLAKKRKRSINNEIAYRLEESLKLD